MTLVVLCLLLVAGCATTYPSFGILEVTCTAPVGDQEYCGGTIIPNPSPLVWVHFVGAGRRDSVLAAQGDTVRMRWTVPGGKYVVMAWASDAGGASRCTASVWVPVK